MALEVYEISRKEVERFFNRQTLLSANKVNANGNYIVVELQVGYDRDYRAYWYKEWSSDWKLTARRQFDDLDTAQEWCRVHHYRSEHFCPRAYQSDCACGFEIWHLVDDEPEECMALPDLLGSSKALATVRFVGDDEVCGNFKTAKRVMFILGFDDPDIMFYSDVRYVTGIKYTLECLNLEYGISSMCSRFQLDEEFGCYTCAILLEYDGPCTAGWWYLHMDEFLEIQRLDWIFYRVQYVSDYLRFVCRNYYRKPDISVGAFDDDKYRRLARIVFDDEALAAI